MWMGRQGVDSTCVQNVQWSLVSVKVWTVREVMLLFDVQPTRREHYCLDVRSKPFKPFEIY